MHDRQTLILKPLPIPGAFKAPDGTTVRPPPGWVCVPPGDAGLTRRLKALGPTWTVQETKGNKVFSRGVWAAAEIVEQARREVDRERADPAHQKRLDAGRARRAAKQEVYVDTFRDAVLAFLRFAPAWHDLADNLADRVTAHATPVGSGTVARTERIPVERRAEAAVIAWMRHQTTRYDDMTIARIRGMRREVRARLATQSRAVLDAHRGRAPHVDPCPLCNAVVEADAAD